MSCDNSCNAGGKQCNKPYTLKDEKIFLLEGQTHQAAELFGALADEHEKLQCKYGNALRTIDQLKKAGRNQRRRIRKLKALLRQK